MGHSKGHAKGKFYRYKCLYLKKKPLKFEASQINNLMVHLNLLEKQEQTKHKTSRKKLQRSGPRLMKSKPNKL
jgi:hypothetical protein